ncbi:MAG TPA: hypothetical protein VGS61_06480, partial [Acidimicrobiales bacterium]|nr:hypothetical protein [Acidimicrobiales bacterium]
MRLVAATVALSGASLVAAVGPSSASGNNLIVNGGFESGSFTPGWSAYNFTFEDSGCGAWSVSSTGEAFVPGPVYNAPVEGNYDAVESQLCPTAGILVSAPFVDPVGARLSLDFAYSNYNEGWDFDASNPFGLDYPATPNQWIRVDVIRSSAVYNTLNPSDIVSTLFDSTVGSPTFYQSWETLSASLAADAGQSLE